VRILLVLLACSSILAQSKRVCGTNMERLYGLQPSDMQHVFGAFVVEGGSAEVTGWCNLSSVRLSFNANNRLVSVEFVFMNKVAETDAIEFVKNDLEVTLPDAYKVKLPYGAVRYRGMPGLIRTVNFRANLNHVSEYVGLVDWISIHYNIGWND